MTKLKNIWHRLLGLSFCLLLCVSFFNLLSIKSAQALAPACGAYLGVGTCANGLAKQLADSVNPPAHNWTCTAGGQTMDCATGIVLCGNGAIDFGEECDGTNLNEQTCADWNGTGQLSCTASCRYDASTCMKAKCGDGKIEGMEQCDGTNLGVPAKTCEDVDANYHSGLLACGNSCNFNTDNCAFCGNGRIDTYDGKTETCDGRDFGGKTCADFGTPPFTNGQLKCSACGQIDTSGCNRSLCGNGIIDGTEECDGANLGVPAKTCASAGCTGGGPVKCQANCTLDKTTCTGCAATKCSNVTSSPWSNPFVVNIPCCGPRDGEWEYNLTENSYGLCPSQSQVKNFRKLFDSVTNTAWYGWTWDCGDTAIKCKAHKEPECPTGVASTLASGCSVSKPYKSRAAYEAGLDAFNTSLYGSSVWRQAMNFKCNGGGLMPQATCGANTEVFKCVNYEGYENQVGAREVRCVAAWAPASACGTLNNRVYKATASVGNCSSDTAVRDFFALTDAADAPALCAPGSKAVNKVYRYGTAFDKPETEVNPYEGMASLGSNYKKWFSWQCQADDGRNGELTDCRATLDTDSCVPMRENAKCGPAEQGRFAYEGPGPLAGFCTFGKLGGKPEYKVSLDRTKPATWSWYCLASDSTKQNAYCSVSASVYCGEANDGVYGSANEARAAGLCGGLHGSVSEDIRSVGNQWTWVCADDREAGINVRCSASNLKCGYADDHSYTPATFEANKNSADFLCSGNTNPSVSLSTNFPAYWTWKCGTNECAATVLECGWANGNDNYYTDSQFGVKKANYWSFMCSNGNAAIRGLSQTNDLGEGGYNPGWLWSCEGDSVKPGGAKDKLPDAMCIAHENKCGYFDGYSIKKDLYNSYKGQSDKKDYFCTYGYEPEFAGDSGYYSMWYCVDGNDLSLKPNKILCQAYHPNCGTAADVNKVYYRQSLESYLTKPFDGTLCNAYGTKVFPSEISANNTWTCGGSPEFSAMTNTDQSLNVQTCSVAPAGCGSTDGSTVLNNDWNECKRSGRSNCLCTANGYARPRYPEMVFDQQKYGGWGATWSCMDSDNSSGAKVCQTKCSDCN